MRVMLVTLCAALSGVAQVPLATGFDVLSPGASRADVKRVFGRTTYGQSVETFKTKDGLFEVTYSDGVCTRGEPWSLPADVVEEVFIVPSGTRRLKDIVHNLSGFTHARDSDVVSHSIYRNDERGVLLTYDREHRKVLDITLRPRAAQAETYSCKN